MSDKHLRLTKTELVAELIAAQKRISELENASSSASRCATGSETESKFCLLFKTMPLGVVFHDANGVVLDANPAAEKILGLTLDQLCGRTPNDPRWKAIHEDGSEFPAETHPTSVALQTGQPINNIVMGVYNPILNEHRWININAVPHFDTNEATPIGVHATFEDFTERKRAESALRISGENYRSLVESSESAIAVLDRQGRMVYANPWTVRVWKDNQAVGKTVFELFPQEYAERYSTAIRHVIDTGISIFDDVKTSINGQIMWFRLSMSPLQEFDGRINKVLLNAWDVTKQKIAENALRKSNRILQESQLIANFGSWTADLALQMFDATPECAHLLGKEPGLLTLDELLEIIHPEDREFMLERWAAALKGSPYEVEHRIIVRGEVRWTHVKAVFIVDKNGTPLTALGITQDITDRKRAEITHRANEKKLLSLVNSQSHYVLRTDLNSTYTYWNDKFKEEFGWLHIRNDFNNTSILESICQYHHQRTFETIEKCIARPSQIFKVELDQPGNDGETRTTLWDFVCLTDENEIPNEIQCMGIDITERKKMEDALRASEEKYRGLVESLDNILYTVDYDGQLLFLNEQAARMAGGSTPEYIGKTVFDIFPESVALQKLQSLRQVMEEDKGIVIEGQSPMNGNMRWYRTTIQPIHNEDGQVIHALINSTDIHDLKVAQQELLAWSQTLEERVRQRTVEVQDLYDNSPTGYHSVDTNGNFVMINRTELRWLGYTQSEVLGRPVTDFLEQTSKLIYEANFLVFKERGWLKDLELEFVRRDGTLLPISLNSIAVYDSDGNYLISRSTILDNSERKRAEQKLRDSEERYRKAISAADAVPYNLDYATNMYTFIGEGIEKLTGYSREEMTPHLFEGLIEQSAMQGDLSPLSTEDATRQVRAGQPDVVHAVWQSDFLVRHKNGEERWLSDISLQIVDANGNITGSIGILQNITERKKAEEALRHANSEMERALRIKDEFLTSMSHELRTPLTGILGLSEALQFDTYGKLNEKQRYALSNIESSGRHLLELINDILDISKLEAGKLDLHMELCSLSDICQSALQLVRGMAHKKNQNIAFSMNPAAIMVNGDVRRLKQVVVNLLSNAVKYSPEDSKIGLEVSADPEKEAVDITVWDEGIGIRQDDLKTLFRPFVQLDSSLSRQQNGTGLGLALVQKLVDLHGGSVQVQSTPGVGSRFTITLSTVPFNPTQPQQNEMLPLPYRKALIVEDSYLDASRLGRYLNMLGVESVTHRTGAGVMERAIKVQPDLILLDILLPDISGWDVLSQLKSHAETSGIPVIVTSVVDEQEKADQLGAEGYLVKLFSQSDLHNAILRLQEGTTQTTQLTEENPNDVETTMATIMLVDDNQINAFMIEDFLRLKHFQVVSARSGVEFLSRVADVRPDLVLMDIQMPELDGLETTRRLRSHTDPKLASVPVIAITALAMPGDRERCLEAGANEYMSKPIRLSHLAQTIQNMLEKDLAS